MAKSPEELAHLEWIGYVQPVGLVVSIPALLEAQCYVNKNIMAQHGQFLNCLPRAKNDEIVPEIRDLAEFTQKVLGWEPEDLKRVPDREALTGNMASLEIVLPKFHETLRPSYVVPAFEPIESESPWLLLVQQWPAETDFDIAGDVDTTRHWHASPQAKFERLLRETGVPIGLLSNRRQLRLVYAPKGESSGHATFNVQEMMQVAGRPMFAALHMLLCTERMFSLGSNQRLPAILQNSRKYQNTVSTKLAEQVLAALYELMRGFQAANDVRNGDLLRDVLANDPNHVYAGLLRVLMRLVFVMYAEDRDLLSSDPIYSNHYSVTGLFNRLREDAGRHPDTMNQRYGAWSQLLTLFRLIYEGGQHGDFRLPARKGYLFDPDRYPFLEGRSSAADSAPIVPRVSDGVVYKVLRNLLILDGERLSYRTLDVEQIGSVYETVMGFNLEVAKGRSIAIKPVKSHGAPATINLSDLLKTPGKDRAKWLKEHSDQTLGKEAAKQLKEAESLEQLLEALDKKIAKKVTPRTVPKGAIVLQPSDERRRSGSHYTPRSLTEPIVRTTLEPILKQLCDADTPLPEVYKPSKDDKRRYTQGEIDVRVRLSERAIEQAKQARAVGTPHPSQILDLKICDPAMGSGAFLVEACRQLADELVKAWYAHKVVPTDIPPDEDEVLYARRQVAQRCLYGVDKNEMAVDLAKLSLWLVTLAKDHPFTFLDHSLCHGDSLVGLTRKQIIGFHWEPKKQKQFGEDLIQKRLDRATESRAKILNAREDVPYRDQETRLANADEALNLVRMTGDACVSAFFAVKKSKEREKLCEELFLDVARHFQALKDDKFDMESHRRIANAAASLKDGAHPIPPFHWEIEFPEVFSRANGGFDAFVGNPPFAGKNTLLHSNRAGYLDWLRSIHDGAHGNSDLVAHFFRRCYSFLRRSGAFGLIATNTIRQGDTRETGLAWICKNGGKIFAASRRRKWPGAAAVVVSIVHVARPSRESSTSYDKCTLDEETVLFISAYLFHRGSHDTPAVLRDNNGTCFNGACVLGMGFTFDDSDSTGAASPLATVESLCERNPKNKELIFPYIGGEEINTDSRHSHTRYIINFGDMPLEQAEQWPDLLEIIEAKVKPVRLRDNRMSYRKHWWQFAEKRAELTRALKFAERALVVARVSKSLAFTFLPARMVFSEQVVVFPDATSGVFAVLQSRIHELWARFFASSLKDDLRYSPSDCYDTFPFPLGVRSGDDLSSEGDSYFARRAEVLVDHDIGLTTLYSRFHDPHEKSMEILNLRELHEAMDRAVLEAYGWYDLAQTARCEFLLDYEEDDEETGKKKSKKKKPWRLRWPDEFRDEVLARLLELNEQRYKEELLIGTQPTKAQKKPKKDEQESSLEQQSLFDNQLDRVEELVLLVVTSMGLMTRRAVDEAVIAMQNDTLRRSRLALCIPPKRMPKSTVGMDAVIGGLLERGWLSPHPSEVSQVLKLGQVKSPLGKTSAKDLERLEQTKLLFQRELEAGTGNVTVNERITDAKPGFVLTG